MIFVVTASILFAAAKAVILTERIVTMTSKTQNKPRKADTTIADLKAQIAQLTQLVTSLANVPVPTATKKQGKVNLEKQAVRDAKKAQYASINESKKHWVESYTVEKAITLAIAEIRKNQKAGFVNAKIAEVSPKSFRRFLTSTTNQSLRAVRKANDVRASEIESMLDSALAKK